jgi:8-oxo-dGTP pyrophosphatase MutT (NUDIX family)
VKYYACAILFDEQRILLGRRSPHRRASPNLWDVIGGRVEDGETPKAALKRELSEEIGIVPTAYRGLGTVVDENVAGRGTATYHLFLVTAWEGGTPAMRNREHTSLDWFSVADALNLPDLALDEYRELFAGLLPSSGSLPGRFTSG